EIRSRQQRLYRVAAVDAVGPALGIAEFGVRADTQKVEDGRRQVFRSVARGNRHAAVAIGLADDLARSDAAAGEEAREDVAPVVPARREDLARRVAAANRDRRDARRAPHLAAHDDQRLVQKAALLQ